MNISVSNEAVIEELLDVIKRQALRIAQLEVALKATSELLEVPHASGQEDPTMGPVGASEPVFFTPNAPANGSASDPHSPVGA